MNRLAILTVFLGMTVSGATFAADGLLEQYLLKSAAEDKAPVVVRLMERGANIEARDAFGSTPLVVAAANGQMKVLKVLLVSGADIDATDADGRTALMHAALRNDDRMYTYLLAKGAGTSFKDITGRTATDVARAKGLPESADLQF